MGGRKRKNAMKKIKFQSSLYNKVRRWWMGNDRANRKCAASDHGVMQSAEEDRRVSNASISDICR